MGGISYTPFLRGASPTQPLPTATKPKSGEAKEEQLIQKEIINVLKENGLPNDVDYFLSKANTFLTGVKNFDISGGSSYDLSDLIRLQSLANRIKHNNQLHKDASKQIIDEGSGSEVAITNTGQLYVTDGQNIQTISAGDFHSTPDEYRILTNSELIRLREESPELAYNGNILNDLKNTVGIKSIVDYVKTTISQFGTHKSSQELDRYTVKQQGMIEHGFEQLLGFASEGVYKVTDKAEMSHQGYTDEESLSAAVNYLYKTLPNNMKNVLRANTAAEGLNPNNIKDVQKLLTAAVLEHTDHSSSVKQEVDFDSSMTKAAGIGVKKAEKTVEQTREEQIVNGHNVVPQMQILQSSDSRTAMHYMVQDYGRPMGSDKKQTGMGTIIDVFTKDPLGHSLEIASISFGGQALSDTDARRVVYDGVSTMQRALLPINKEEFARTGKIVPDFNAQRRFEEFQKWIDAGYGVMPNSILMKMRELDLDLYQDENGNWRMKSSDLKPFMLMNGYASDLITNINPKSGWLHNVDESEGERLYNNYLRFIKYGTDTPKKNAVSREDVDRYVWNDDDEHLYKSIIAIPINDPAIATVTTNNTLAPQDMYVDMLNRRQTVLDRQGIQTNF